MSRDQANHLNTPRLVADATGTTVWRWDQAEPFGDSPADENPSGLGAFDLPLRLPGQYYDAESGNAQNWMRDYSPTFGRYVQSDPMGIAGGLNTYLYVSARPTSRTDITGLVGLEEGLPEAYSAMCDAYGRDKIREWSVRIEREQQSLGPCQRKCYIACFFFVQSELGECPRSSFFEIFPYNRGCDRQFITGIKPGHWKCIRGIIMGKSNNSCCRP